MKYNYLIILFIFLTFHCLSQTFHSIIVIDKEDQKFGSLSEKVETDMIKIHTEMSKKIKYKLVSYDITKKNFDVEFLKKTLEELKTEPNDIIYFFYSGYGNFQNTIKSKYPFLKLKNSKKNPISIDQIGEILKLKQAKLKIIMADCRDTELAVKPFIESSESNTTGVRVDNSIATVNSLINNSCGLIYMSSMEFGQKSYVIKPSTYFPETKKTSYFKRSSAFMLSFINAYDELTKRKNLFINFKILADSTQTNLNKFINMAANGKPSQKMATTFDICFDKLPTMVFKKPLIEEPKNIDELDKKLNQLSKINDGRVRTEFISVLSSAFRATASISVLRVPQFPFTPGTKTTAFQMPIDNFFDYLDEFDPKVKNIIIDKNGDKNKKLPLLELKLIEVYRN